MQNTEKAEINCRFIATGSRIYLGENEYPAFDATLNLYATTLQLNAFLCR
jgi:hypothetical protein